MSDQDTIDKVFEHQGRISALEANYKTISDGILRIETKLSNAPTDCHVGVDHEKRITALELKPKEDLNKKSTKAGMYTAIGAVLLATASLLLDILWKKP